MSRFETIALGCAAVALVAPAAQAQSPAQAKRFGAAQKLYDTGAYTPALAEFQALAAETGSPNAQLYVARCLRELGRLPEAYEAMAGAVRNATARAESEPKYAATRNAAAADLALLEAKVGKLVIALASPPEGLAVSVAGADLPREKVGVPIAVVPGEVVVRARAAGRPDIERRVVLKAGETQTVTLTFPAASAAPPPPRVTMGPQAAPNPSAPSSREAEPKGVGGARVGGFVTLGVGVAGMATFAVAGLMANHRYDTVSAACGGKRCTDPKYADEIAGGRRLDVIADVGLGVGIAGLVGGTLMVIFGGPSAPPKSGATLGGWAGPDGAGLVVRGAY
jgi:hypothetical protein